jgi:hypothetical protein
LVQVNSSPSATTASLSISRTFHRPKRPDLSNLIQISAPISNGTSLCSWNEQYKVIGASLLPFSVHAIFQISYGVNVVQTSASLTPLNYINIEIDCFIFPNLLRGHPRGDIC